MVLKAVQPQNMETEKKTHRLVQRIKNIERRQPRRCHGSSMMVKDMIHGFMVGDYQYKNKEDRKAVVQHVFRYTGVLWAMTDTYGILMWP